MLDNYCVSVLISIGLPLQCMKGILQKQKNKQKLRTQTALVSKDANTNIVYKLVT